MYTWQSKLQSVCTKKIYYYDNPYSEVLRNMQDYENAGSFFVVAELGPIRCIM